MKKTIILFVLCFMFNANAAECPVGYEMVPDSEVYNIVVIGEDCPSGYDEIALPSGYIPICVAGCEDDTGGFEIKCVQ